MNYANIILEMLERIKLLEKEVMYLKENSSKKEQKFNSVENDCLLNCSSQKKRDSTRYVFDGNVYLKNYLVLAVVKKYISVNSKETINSLKNAFPKSLQGSIGVVEESSNAKKRNDWEKRFFIKEEDVIHLKDGEMYVCNQWGILNIPNFIKHVQNLGYVIEAII